MVAVKKVAAKKAAKKKVVKKVAKKKTLGKAALKKTTGGLLPKYLKIRPKNVRKSDDGGDQ